MSFSKGEHLKVHEGDVIDGRFRVIREVGCGNFSKVYSCYDLTRSREDKRKVVAVKIIKREYKEDAYFEKQMLQILGNKDRAGNVSVCRMIEFFEWKRCPVFVMSIHGPSLRARRLGYSGGVVTRDKLLQISYSLLETFRFIHFDCRMVHTDVKPENILLVDPDTPKFSLGSSWVVCDFGSASLWRMDRLDSDLISTRPYRAPEVILGCPWFYAADMWSMGCILFEVATGQRLFEVRDDNAHLQLMERRLGPLPETFTRYSKDSSKYFTSTGSFLEDSEYLRSGKVSTRSLLDVLRDDPELYDLISSLLMYDPMQRITAADALRLPLFRNIHLLSSKSEVPSLSLDSTIIGDVTPFSPRPVPPTNESSRHNDATVEVRNAFEKDSATGRGHSAPSGGLGYVTKTLRAPPPPPQQPQKQQDQEAKTKMKSSISLKEVSPTRVETGQVSSNVNATVVEEAKVEAASGVTTSNTAKVSNKVEERYPVLRGESAPLVHCSEEIAPALTVSPHRSERFRKLRGLPTSHPLVKAVKETKLLEDSSMKASGTIMSEFSPELAHKKTQVSLEKTSMSDLVAKVTKTAISSSTGQVAPTKAASSTRTATRKDLTRAPSVDSSASETPLPSTDMSPLQPNGIELLSPCRHRHAMLTGSEFPDVSSPASEVPLEGTAPPLTASPPPSAAPRLLSSRPAQLTTRREVNVSAPPSITPQRMPPTTATAMATASNGGPRTNVPSAAAPPRAESPLLRPVTPRAAPPVTQRRAMPAPPRTNVSHKSVSHIAPSLSASSVTAPDTGRHRGRSGTTADASNRPARPRAARTYRAYSLNIPFYRNEIGTRVGDSRGHAETAPNPPPTRIPPPPSSEIFAGDSLAATSAVLPSFSNFTGGHQGGSGGRIIPSTPKPMHAQMFQRGITPVARSFHRRTRTNAPPQPPSTAQTGSPALPATQGMATRTSEGGMGQKVQVGVIRGRRASGGSASTVTADGHQRNTGDTTPRMDQHDTSEELSTPRKGRRLPVVQAPEL